MWAGQRKVTLPINWSIICKKKKIMDKQNKYLKDTDGLLEGLDIQGAGLLNFEQFTQVKGLFWTINCAGLISFEQLTYKNICICLYMSSWLANFGNSTRNPAKKNCIEKTYFRPRVIRLGVFLKLLTVKKLKEGRRGIDILISSTGCSGKIVFFSQFTATPPSPTLL